MMSGPSMPRNFSLPPPSRLSPIAAAGGSGSTAGFPQQNNQNAFPQVTRNPVLKPDWDPKPERKARIGTQVFLKRIAASVMAINGLYFDLSKRGR